MSKATRHLERLLKVLQFDSTLGGCSTCNEIIPSTYDSIQSSDFDDHFGKETSLSSRVSLLSNSESDDVSTPTGGNGSKYYHAEIATLVQQLGDSRVRVATLEAQIEFLTNKVKEQETLDSLYIQRLEEEVLRLKETIEQEMNNLARRQNKVEQDVPSLEEQLSTIKDALYDFEVPEALYMELKLIPEQCRTPREYILILAYEKYQCNQKEIQELQMSQSTSREALTRANDEVQRLTRELQRVATNHTTGRYEFELDLSARNTRIERLEAELHDSLVQIEVLKAKGALFDEVQGKLEILECNNIDAENQKVVMATTLQVAIQEKESLQDSIKEKDHILDLLSMDKIYLSKEVHCKVEQLKKLEAELNLQHKKLREVKCEQTNKDVENICKEANAFIDETFWTFCKMKDGAMAAAEVYRLELQNSKAAYDELFLKFQELQRVTNLKEVETYSNMKVANFELDQMKVILEEIKNAFNQTRLENEAWVAKVKILKELVNEEKNWSIEELMSELEKPINELKEELQVTRVQLEAYQKEKNIQFKAYDSEKDVQLKAFQNERKSQLEIHDREKAKSMSILRAESLDNNKSKLKERFQETEQLEELRYITKEKDRVSIRLQSIQEDIRKLLLARGSVEQLQCLLKEKGIFIGGGSRLKSINKKSLKVKKGSISPQISNLDHSAPPSKEEIHMMIEYGEIPLRCNRHRSCPPHYPKTYKESGECL